MGLRIAIFDDNNSFRESIGMLLLTEPGFELVGSFSNVMHCVQDVKQCRPDIILMDIEMPGINGIEAVRSLKKEYPHITIMMQTVFEDDERVFDSICAGATGYILKNQITFKLIDFIKELQYGGAPMSPVVARKVLSLMQGLGADQGHTKIDYRLTSREKEVLACIVNGLSLKMVAGELYISYETVRSHVKNIYEKLHVASLTEAVGKALKEKIV